MDYKLVSPKLQDLVTRAETMVAAAGELGTLLAGNLLIPSADIKADMVASDVLVAYNETQAEALTATISGDNLSLDGTNAIVATDVIRLTVNVNY